MKKNIILLVIAAALGYLAYTFYQKDTGNTIDNNPLTDFAIADTAEVYKIFIADDQNGTITLTRKGERNWLVDDKYKAKMGPVNLLLETFAGAGIQSTIPETQKEAVLRSLAITQRKVMIFGKNDEWIKTWYVGGATRNSQGTYMILETPESGVSSEPFIVEKRGFRGFLTSRFHTSMKDWRSLSVFEYPDMDIKKVSVIRPKSPEKGFEVNVKNIKTNDIELLDHEGKPMTVDPKILQLYLLGFQKMSLETFDPPLLDDAQEDSVMARKPDFRINVVDNKGNNTKIDLQYKGYPKGARLENPNLPEIDMDRMFGTYEGELIQVQRQMFDPILAEPQGLIKASKQL